MAVSHGDGPLGAPEPRRTGELGQAPPIVLIIEDDPKSLETYTTILEYNGFAVMSAVGGATGIEQARSFFPNLVLLNIAIRGTDGWAVTRTLKNDSRTSSIPIVILSPEALSSERERAFKEADGYVANPTEPGRLMDEVRRVIGEA